MRSNQNPCALRVGWQSGAAMTQNSKKAPQKLKHRMTPRSSSSASESICKRSKSGDSRRYLHTHTHSYAAQNGQEMEATKMPTDR